MFIPIEKVSPEGVFARHYDWLLKWAEYLVRGRQEQAEDLVHELFIQFQRTSPDLATDEEAKAYLYRSLRNLFLSSVARTTVAQQHQLSIYDYDNFRIGISAIDRGSLLSVREDLWSICRYACERKASLRAASYFILRFFLEYCPSEIMALACTTRAAFDKNIQLMRGEVCSYLQRPRSASVTHRPAEETKLDESEGDLFQQLSRFIHTLYHGSCLTQEEIRFLYSAGTPVETAVLAHLVSCEHCRAACLHHLDKDSQPNATFSHRRAAGPKSSGLSLVRRSRHLSFNELHRRYQENFEHRPAYMHLSIAGKTEASQRITSVRSELAASLRFEEMPVFVEITGEQGIRMLSLLLDEDLNQPGDMQASTPLSDGRSLHMEASSRAGSLQIRVTYIDPVVEQDDEEPSFLPIRLAHVPSAPRPLSPAASIKDRIRQRFTNFYWPSAITGAAALALVLSVSITQAHHRYLRQQALGILADAERTEKATVSRYDVHRAGIFEMVGPDSAHRHQRVELWQSSMSSSRRAMRLYGADGREQAFTLKSFEVPNDLKLEDVWRIGFETSFFEQIFRDAPLETVKEEANTYRIEAHSDSQPVHGIVEADIVLDRNSDRVVERGFVMRRAEGDYHVRFVETQYEITPRGHLGPEMFAPQSSDASPASGQHNLPKAVSTQPRSELVSQQIKALWQLQQAGVEPEEQIAVSRHGQSLRVSGVVMTEQRKQHLTDSLLVACPSCELDLQTAQRHRSNVHFGHIHPTTLQTSDVTLGASDAENLLRPTLSRQGLDIPQIRERSAASAMELIGLAARLLRDTDALEQSAACCSRAELASLGVADRQLWLRLLSTQSEQAEGSLAELEGKMADLNMLVGISVSRPAWQDPDRNDGLAQIRHLHNLAVTLQLSLQHFSAAGFDAEQDATPHWQQILMQTQILRQQLNLASSFVRNPR